LIKKSKSSQTDNRRRRRKPEAAESEILNAAENFLKEFPFREMTVDDIMARTGLSRPSFYEYFRDRSHLIVKLIERLNERDRAVSARWFTDPDPVESLRHTIRDLVQAYISNGHLLRALSDATHVYENVEASYRERFEVVIRETGRRIGEFMARGVVSLEGVDPQEIAAALLWMNERYMIEKFGREPHADPKVVTDTLVAIWSRVLHGAVR
jgi:AcrR family transcriptional regulator